MNESIDPRGPRFGAMVTSTLLAVTVLLGTTPAAIILLAVVAVLFAWGALRGTQHSLQGIIFRLWVRPRLSAPSHLEDPRPPRFAQAVGLAVAATGLTLAAFGVVVAVPIAAGVAFVASFLNAAFGFCLGCEIYLLVRPGLR
jgi:hypothetical protein